MSKLTAYLNFPGTSEEAFTFYQSVLGGELMGPTRFKDTPQGAKLSPEEGEKAMHVALKVGSDMLMATDALASMGHTLKEGNNFNLCLNVDSQEEADRIYAGLSEGGKQTMPMKDEFWGDYFGMLTDRFGIHWMIAFSHPRA